MEEKSITIKVEDVDESRLPDIIKTEVATLTEFMTKKDEARQKAEEAKQFADELQGVKFGKTKAAVEDLQKAAQALADAQVLAADAQEKSFEYQEKLASTSKYLFALGVTNMAMNRSVVRELKMTLEGADADDLDDAAHQEIINVINQLKAQEDIMQKQENMSASLYQLDEEVDKHDRQIKKNAEELIRKTELDKKQSQLISEGIEKDKLHDRLFAENDKKDAEQDRELAVQAEKDKEHDEQIKRLQEEIDTLRKRTEQTTGLMKYRIAMVITLVISIISLIIGIMK